MTRSARVSVALPAEQASSIRRIVEAGEFASASAIVREAVRAWLQRRALHGGRHGAQRLSRLQWVETPEPFERVELLFDAGDASGG